MSFKDRLTEIASIQAPNEVIVQMVEIAIKDERRRIYDEATAKLNLK
jgi:hypothetical protein